MKTLNLFSITLLISLLPNYLIAQDGSLDLSFDTNGIARTSITKSVDVGRSIAVQKDGKIIVAGYSNNGNDVDFAVIRYQTNGSLDSTFSLDGIVTTKIGNDDDKAFAVAIQSDGKIVVAGYSVKGSTVDYVVVRYLSNGNLDSTFDIDGIVTTLIGSVGGEANSILIQKDGKIIVAGSCSLSSSNGFALVRYNTDGKLDTTFDSDGIVTTVIGSSDDVIYSIALQSNGKIIAAGKSYNSNSFYNFALARYNTDGSLDKTFDTDGILTTKVGSSNNEAYAVVIQKDDKILVTGFSNNGTNDAIALVRYHADGSLDTTFDSDGIVTSTIGSNYNNQAFAVVIQNDGKIVVAGYSQNSSNFAIDITLFRYKIDGSVDSTFDSDGFVITPIGLDDEKAYAMTLQTDGKILVAGYTSIISDLDFVLVRYNNTMNTGISEYNNNSSKFSVYPNPLYTIVNIHTDFILNHATLIVYNVMGQQMKQLNNLSGNNIIFNREDLPSGQYFVKIFQNDQTILTTQIIIND